jgi:hypothetical protein
MVGRRSCWRVAAISRLASGSLVPHQRRTASPLLKQLPPSCLTCPSTWMADVALDRLPASTESGGDRRALDAAPRFNGCAIKGGRRLRAVSRQVRTAIGARRPGCY